MTTNGIFRPVALVEGRVVATWRLPSSGVVLDPLEHLDDACICELIEEAGDVRRFLGLAPAPMSFAERTPRSPGSPAASPRRSRSKMTFPRSFPAPLSSWTLAVSLSG